MVGQYWCDEAYDAVQYDLIWSTLETPDLQAAAESDREDIAPDSVNLDGRSHFDLFHFAWYQTPGRSWAPNTLCIPLFAGFCVEGGHQEGDFLEFESPVATYRRTGPAEASFEFVGELVRPWLEGVAYSGSTNPGGEPVYDYAAFEEWATTGHG